MTHPSLAHPLRGRTALVTGVSRRRGIGYAVAKWTADPKRAADRGTPVTDSGR